MRRTYLIVGFRSCIFAVLLLCLYNSAHAQRRFGIASIRISGNDHLTSDEILRSFSSKPGDTLREEMLERDIERTLKQYEDIGYPLARITIEKIVPHDSGSLDISLRVREGKRPRIVAVNVTGSIVTDSNIIAREFFLGEHPYFDKGSLESGRTRIEHLGIFNDVGPPQLFALSDSTVGVSIALSETHSTYIDGIIGYNPPLTPHQSGFVNGFISLGFTNIAGTARNASLDFSKETRTAQQLAAQYSEPWLFGLPINGGISFLQRDEDSIYTRTNIMVTPVFLLSSGLSLSASFAYDRVVPGASQIVYDSRSLIIGVGGKFDTRNLIAAPTSGFLLGLEASFGSKSIQGATTFDSLAARTLTVRSLSLDAAWAIRTFSERLIFIPSLSAKMTDITNGQLDESDLFRIGGLRTLRGYFESQFLVSRFVIVHLDYRFMTGHTSFLGLFTDYGYLERPMTTTFAGQTIYPLGYGISFQFDTQLGILSASIGLAKNDTPDRAKLHFGIIRDF